MEPFVSVVVCTMKGVPERLQRDLDKQTYKNFEVLVAAEKGIVSAMNSALDRAKGEIFVRIDDDVELPPQWLEELIGPFDQYFYGGVTGPTLVPKERRQNRDSIKLFERPNLFLKWLMDGRDYAPAAIYKCGMVSYDSNYEERFTDGQDGFSPDHLEGTNWAMRTELIRKVGGFDPKFDGVAEWYDTDVEQKIKKLGYRLCYARRAPLYHLLEKGSHFNERFEGFGRIKNWLRFNIRHSRFHPKMIIWFLMMVGYFVCKRFQK